MAESCPSLDVLRDMLEGRLSAAVAGEVETHIDGCAACLTVLESLDGQDPVLHGLCRPGELAAAAPTGFVEAFISRYLAGQAKTLPHFGSLPISIDAGPDPRPSERVNSFGDYDLLQEIGAGGMGVIYKARQRSVNRIVALKMIRRDKRVREQDVLRFRAESQAAARLDHPGIVRVFDAGVHAGQHFYSMLFVVGQSLAERLTAVRRLPVREAAELMRQVADAVHYAHERGVVHRDLKPGNIMLEESQLDGQKKGDAGATQQADKSRIPWIPKVTDFGLAKLLDSDLELTKPEDILGTVIYMAPEQAGNSHRVGPLADVYALGATLYAVLAGRPPFQASTMLETLEQVKSKVPPVSPRVIVPGLPRDMETIVMRCLEKEPARRYASAAEVSAELGRYLRGEPIEARPVGAIQRAWRWCRRKPLAAALLAAMTLLATGGPTMAVVMKRQADELREKTGTLQTRSTQLAKANVIANDNKELAIKKADELAVENKRARRSIQTLQLNRFAAELERDSFAAARLLEDTSACPLDLHDFAWRYCRRLASRSLQTWRWDSSMPSAVQYAADGELIAVGDFQGTVHLWNRTTRETLRDLHVDNRAVWGMAFSPDGRHLAVAVGNIALNRTAEPGAILVWNLADGELAANIDSHSDRVRTVAFSPDGTFLASGSDDKSIRFWDTVAWQETRQLTGHTLGVSSLVFLGNDSLASAGGDNLLPEAAKSGELFVWDLAEESPPRQLAGHKSDVVYLAATPDGSVLASAGRDQTVRLWDVAAGRQTALLAGHEDKIWGLAFSPDGAVLASVGTAGETDGASLQTGTGTLGEVRLWDAEKGSPRGMLRGHALTVDAVAFAPDSQTIATTSLDGTLQLWTAEPRVPQVSLVGGSRSVRCLAVSPDGELIATANEEDPAAKKGTIRLWNQRSGQPLRELNQHQGEVMGLAFSPDGKLLASAGQDNKVMLWDVADGEVRTTWTDDDSPNCPTFSRDGRLLACGSGLTVWVRDIATGNIVATMLGHDKEVSEIAFSPTDAGLLASGSYDGVVRLWNVSEGSSRQVLRGHAGTLWNSVTTLAFSPDGMLLASGGYDTHVILWDVAGGGIRFTLKGHDRPVSDVAFSSDGATLASAGHDSRVILWDPVAGREQLTRTVEGQGATCLEFLHDDTGLAVGLAEGIVELSQVGSEPALAVLRGHALPWVSGVAISPDETWLATVAIDKTVRLWDVKTGQITNTLTGHEAIMTAVCISADGESIASVDHDNVVKLWEASTGKELQSFSVRKAAPNVDPAVQAIVGAAKVGYTSGLAFSPGGKLLATATMEKDVKIWSVPSGEPAHTLKGHKKKVIAVTFGLDDNTLLSCGEDKTVRLWNLAEGQTKQTWTADHPLLSLAMSRDGRSIIAGGEGEKQSGVIYVFDVDQEKPRLVLLGHERPVTAVGLSDDGQTLAAADMGHSVKLWNLVAGQEIKELKQHRAASIAYAAPVAISRSGRLVLSGGPDDAVQLWRRPGAGWSEE